MGELGACRYFCSRYDLLYVAYESCYGTVRTRLQRRFGHQLQGFGNGINGSIARGDPSIEVQIFNNGR